MDKEMQDKIASLSLSEYINAVKSGEFPEPTDEDVENLLDDVVGKNKLDRAIAKKTAQSVSLATEGIITNDSNN